MAEEDVEPEVEEGAEQEPEEAEQPQGGEDAEDRARRMGWVPQEEFRGDPNRWVDAETFLERGENELPILRERLRKMERQNQDLSKEVRQFVREMGKQQKSQHEQSMEDIKRKREQAVEDGDIETYRQYDKQLEQMAQNAPEVPEPKEADDNGWTPDFKETFESWKQENSWYEKDPLLSKEFADFHDWLLGTNPEMDDSDRLKKAEQAVKDKYPQKFKKQPKGSPVEGGTQRKGKNSKGYDDLPSEAKAAYDKFVTKKKIMSGDEYLKEYFGEQ